MTLPGGEYAATVARVEIKRNRTRHWQLAVTAKADLEGELLTARTKLAGPDSAEPLHLAPARIEGLGRFATRLGLTVQMPISPPVVIRQIEHGVGMRVTARVANTPIGPVVTLLPHHVATPEVVHGDEAEVAFKAEQRLLRGLSATRAGFVDVARACYELRETSGWAALGYNHVSDFLAQPAITMSRASFFGSAQLWDYYVVRGGVQPEALASADRSKLQIALPHVVRGTAIPDDVVVQATELGVADMREEYPALRAKDGDVTVLEPKPGDVLEAECRQIAGELAWLERDEARGRLLAAADAYREAL